MTTDNKRPKRSEVSPKQGRRREEEKREEGEKEEEKKSAEEEEKEWIETKRQARVAAGCGLEIS